MANLRVHIAKKLGLIPESGHGGHSLTFSGSWDPPLRVRRRREALEWQLTTRSPGRTTTASTCWRRTPGKVLCWRYDLVLNGFEIGGGSIRLHDPAVQEKVFRALGISDVEAHRKFGFLLDALKFGAPRTEESRLGLDRLAMLLSGAESLRDVIPFPKTQRGTDLMTDAPNTVSPEQLVELSIRVVEPPV